jgi:hypothetical protein
MVRPERFELPTPWFEAKYSIQLSYGRTVVLKRAETIKEKDPEINLFGPALRPPATRRAYF